ncbi:MAG: hypothetical protein Q4B17_02515 [Lautropia sp.]|nr:hypothetical protein [Lautropia sp.]
MSSSADPVVRLDLNNPVFQRDLFGLQKHERHAALDTLSKLRRLMWAQVHRDKGLRWEKIISVKPPPGVPALYSLRITQARRAVAYRDGDFIRLLAIPRDHDVNLALRTLVQLRQEETLRSWRGKLRWDGDLEGMRLDADTKDSFQAIHGMLKGRTNGAQLSIDQINDAIADGAAQADAGNQ